MLTALQYYQYFDFRTFKIFFFQIAPRWKPKSRPYNGDTIIAKSSGSNIKLSCPAYGSPKPTTQWFKDEAAFDASQRPKVIRGRNVSYIYMYIHRSKQLNTSSPGRSPGRVCTIVIYNCEYSSFSTNLRTNSNLNFLLVFCWNTRNYIHVLY